MAKKISITERITESLRLEITNGAYRSDSLLTEVEISQAYGVSKTPAREALSQLCAEGLLEKIPHKGYLLKRYTAADLENLLQFRHILETSGVELAIKMASDQGIAQLRNMCDQYDALSEEEAVKQYIVLNREFHIALISLAKNPFMTSVLANILDQLRLALSVDLAEHPKAVKLTDHREIVDALEQRDVERAKALVGKFTDNVYRRLPDNYSKLEHLWF